MNDKLYCTYCGALNDKDASFCERCGHALEPLEPLTEAGKTASRESDNLLEELMAEPVTPIPEEPVRSAQPAKKTKAAMPAAGAAYDVPGENTQVFSRADLEKALAASNAEQAAQREAAEAARREAAAAARREEQLRAAMQRRQQEDALYSEYETRNGRDAGYGGAGYDAAPKKKKTWIPVLIILLVLLAAGGFFGWKFLFNKTNVDLTRNISAQDIYLEGYDGEAAVIIDDETMRARADYPRGNEKAEQFMETVTYMAEPASGLSNGDTVVIRAVYSEETAKSLHINVKGEEKKFEVSGLDEKASIDWDPLNLFGDDDKEAGQDEQNKDTLIPEIDKRYYTDRDVQGKSKEEIQAMLNELYARHGYIFKDETLKKQYEKQSWYKGTETDMAKVEQSFNTYEKKNLEYLTDVRSKM